MEQCKVSLERLKRKYAERMRGKKQAKQFMCETYKRTSSAAYRARHASQNPN